MVPSATKDSSPWCILGGDRRDTFFALSLLRKGYAIRTCGLPPSDALPKEIVYADPKRAVDSVRVLICPVTGTDDAGYIRKSSVQTNLIDIIEHGKDLQLLVIGTAKAVVREACEKRRLRFVESMADDELAILNSIPSAEGAIQMAMAETDFTIHGSDSVVLGFGRTGQTLAWMLRGIGSSVTVAARKPQDLARIIAYGHRAITFTELGDHLGRFDLIFNTAPAMVLPADKLRSVRSTALIIDLASPPGGVDFDAAKELGIKAILAPGLPGLVAPRTAGEILSCVVPRLIASTLA